MKFRPTPWLLIVVLALALRLLYVIVIEPAPDFSGGDANWYMLNGHDLVKFGKTRGPLQTAPLYLVFLGVVQHVVPGTPFPGYAYTTDEMQTVRVIQAFLGAGLVLWVYLLADRLLSRRVAGLVALILAISPALIVEAGNLTTEGLFLFWVFGGLAVYVVEIEKPSPFRRRDLRSRVGFPLPQGEGKQPPFEGNSDTETSEIASDSHAMRFRRSLRQPLPGMLIAGGLFGLATLTRAVFLLFPLILAAHLALTRRDRWRRSALVLLASYGLVVSTWTVYNLAVWNRLVIGGEGIASFLYQGAKGEADPDALDQQIGVTPEDDHADREAALRDEAVASITGDPVGWAMHRVKDLGKAYLQPHNTVQFGGQSIKTALSDWAQQDRSWDGLRAITRIEAFWPKLTLYGFHVAGLLLGAAGMVLLWRRWRDLLPLYGVIGYFTGIHLLLLALPRYVFPTYPVFWLFASALLLWVAARGRDTVF